ncbi:ribonuclease HII [Flaviflexus massiliensis]|uniref:ribonuclease HII n=1 Tax=Flaviflexus massiliensis TaxID=1522309 RepID=UPI000AF2D6FD|nr:ribonuclease HII [Flaviflexus massiliensis]
MILATSELEQMFLAELTAELGRPATIVGIDEVGRGALAGPVAVGAVLLTTDTGPAPEGLADSKLLRPAKREQLVTEIHRWTPGVVGYGSVQDINEHGIMGGLRAAGMAALAQLPVTPDLVLLDGSANWLAGPDLFAGDLPPVKTIIKGDQQCTIIAAASIIAKVERDRVMSELDGSDSYSWKSNKGYASPAHVDALTRLGPHRHHRTAWHLPGVRHE